MRTTFDLQDEVFRAVKILAAKRGITLKQFLRTAVEKELQRRDSTRCESKISFPVLDSKKPGSLNLTNAEIEDLLA